MYLVIGVDDTDWEGGGCTTYVMYSFIKALIKEWGEDLVVGLPRLTRLNPYVPFKTRGNASLSVVLNIGDHDPRDFVELMSNVVHELTVVRGKTSPGIAYILLSDLKIPERLSWFYRKTVSDVVTRDLAYRVAERVDAVLIGGRGVIGALASLGFVPRDVTYEFTAYRDPSNDRPRVSPGVVKPWDESTRPLTFLNIYEDQVLIEPHGPDPVLFGVRGDSPYHVMSMGNYLAELYSALGWVVYVTNQGTGENSRETPTHQLIPYTHVSVVGVITHVEVDEDGHAHVTLDNGVKAIAYRHLRLTGKLVKCVGCLVHVWGGYKPGVHDEALYIEGFRVLHDAVVTVENPRCPRCGGPMESVGREGILRCKVCGFRDRMPRIIRARGGWVMGTPVPSEYRHLMKPIDRVGLEGLGLYIPKPSLWIY
ncbi:TiaS agmantine-binding domain-containing protein [Vulcanisaeta thermophila]|uniref:TiaS agmantine-binding domain-containing protein n=1 Tax=Vulcanisaeta thermophila TaxID=867917 RepID=UPI000852915E|nr:DUF1743 domain-containing protein [Vulcanisaeta thermophila]